MTIVKFRSPLVFLARCKPLLGSASVAIPRAYFGTKKKHGDDHQEKPFDKVLIANRGEIVQRVIKTCKDLDIRTVAIHSTADSKAPFVQEADEAICIGPPPANQSYLRVDKILDAIERTGAQAVHPGYGFLSENAKFSQTLTDAGVTWLGPPASAVHSMGDKLESKRVAEAANVNCVPGYDGVVESVDHAIQICNDIIGYPVLLKAAAGGGGKGMRVCYSDQDVKEAWGIAKSESLNFFSDDRLLLEKYIERPHHIEFQLLAGRNPETKEIDVCVFPERECSIQRRNQKVIEETPSVLLKAETRLAMAEQVERLCQATAYESAGTVEFLVDENQNFYFLEMNTRLQVEHGVTEAVTDVDLVKGMLWVGAGWGLPPEFYKRDGLIMPHRGHAIEARIYAEDPLRGYLPSIGPLSPYVEPSTSKNTPHEYIRIESGVADGHVVSPYYDPMLSKIIARAPDREKAIDKLMNALDEYVIQGVQHNAKLVQSVLREPDFRKGDTPTSFLPSHYPGGWTGVELSENEMNEFAIAVAMIGSYRRELLDRPPLAARNEDSLVVCLGGMFGSAYRVRFEDSNVHVENMESGAQSTMSAKNCSYEPRKYVAEIEINGKARKIQVLKEYSTGEYLMQMYGADMPVLIQSLREYELSKHMHEPIIADTSNLILSPMPGTLISFAVNEGDDVEEGQELCIVEAMKMQNIIRSPRKGKIGKCNVIVGASLMADDKIIEFEEDEVA